MAKLVSCIVSILQLVQLAERAGLNLNQSQTLKTGFLKMRSIEVYSM